ncbi:hypothetical protein JQX08_10740 [Pseudomonas sp. UL073]|uniref:O-Antigen ligase n=1 Tax=Zestomonas insulae TaxID=2809017 RepID=A0ABS2IFT8_9GAMM|nr:hypothetical protein [Pseudomonas insulae]MBM7061184.1 hypothetical protein [Pseudomonas insulae]
MIDLRFFGGAVIAARAELLKLWPIFALLVPAALNLLGLSNKQFAMLLYVFCLLPALFFWRGIWQGVQESLLFWCALLLFAAYCQVSSLVLFGQADSELKYVALLLLFFGFVRTGFAEPDQVRRLQWSLLLVAGLLIGYALLLHPFESALRYDFGGVNANRVAVFFCFVFCWSIWRGLEQGGGQGVALVISGLLLLLATFVLLKSRSIFLCFMFFVAGIVLFAQTRLVLRRALLLVLAVALGGLVVSVEPFRSWFFERGGSYRLEIWSDALAHMTSMGCHWLGCGQFDGYKFLSRFDNPHGLLFSIFYYHGMLGLLLFVTVLAVGFIRLSGFYRAWLCGFLGFSLFTHVGVLAAPTLLWIYFWLPLALGLQERGRHA